MKKSSAIGKVLWVLFLILLFPIFVLWELAKKA